MALPQIQKILTRLAQSPARYSEVLESLNEVNRTGRTAYYLRRLLTFHCVEQKNKKYQLTWKGIKTREIYKMISEFQNVTIQNYDPNKTFEFVNIQSSQTWLEPYLQKTIEQILRNCQNQSRSRRA